MYRPDDTLTPATHRMGRRRWRHALSLSIVALLLVSMLAACGGGGDDDDDATPTTGTGTGTSAATATTPAVAAASPTTADEPTSTTAASPTATTPAVPPTAQATAPTRPIATQPPVAPSATTGTDDGAAAIEAALIDILVTDVDLGTGWTLDSIGPDEEGDPDSSNICDTPDFPFKDAKIAQVEAQSEYNAGGVGGFYVENLTVFPEDVALEALAYAVTGASCGTWVDDSGNEHVLTPVDDPGLGDESAAYAWQLTTQGQVLSGYYAFVRTGPIVALVGWLGLPALDDEALMLVTADAIDRATLLAGELASGGTAPAGDLQAQAENALLTAAQLDTILPGWTDLGLVDTDFADRYTVCDNLSFADQFTTQAEAAAEYELDGQFQGSLMHGLVVMADGEGAAVFEQIRADAACGTWTDGDTTITLNPQPDPAIGDETFVLLLDVVTSSGQSGYAAIAYTRWQDVISVLAAVSFDPIDPAFFEAAQQQAEQNIAAS